MNPIESFCSLLEGVRIVSVEQFGAGPYGTQLLADMGAEVIKIENPKTGGDVSRITGPYFLGDSDSEFFQTFNRGKKSVCLDLKKTQDRKHFEQLVATADALANNLRGDQPAKLGLRYEDLKAVNPKLVCAHLSAYGRDNPRAAWPGYDYLMQAEAGFFDLTGEPDGPPARFGLSMVDFMTGSMLALGISSGIIGARTSGKGCDVDTCLFDVALHQLSYPATWFLNEGAVTSRLSRSSHPSTVPSQLFPTADGWLMLMCQTPKFWQLFCELVERAEWLSDPRYKDIPSRREHREALQQQIDELLRSADTAHWVDLLSGKVPVAPVHDIRSALENPYLNDIEMLNTVEHPAKPDGLRMLSSPLKVNGRRPPSVRGPEVGEHTDEILSNLGSQ